MGLSALGTRGWARFAADERSRAWAAAAFDAGRAALADPVQRAHGLVCEGTWFVGLDALPNDATGALGTIPFAGPATDALTPLPPLHRGQVSAVFPGYPRPRGGESEAAFRYRARRDAAHVDGITAEGPDRRRFVTEPHAFILGLPLNAADPEAAPLVVWEGSHRLVGDALRRALAPVTPAERRRTDVTEIYQATRRTVFDTGQRITLHAAPGEALLLHRHLLHGIAPWQPGAEAPPEGRMIAYFRPAMPGGLSDWLDTDRLV